MALSIRWLPAAVALASGCVSLATAAPLTPERAVQFRRSANLAFSPDGRWLVCTVTEFEKGQPRAHLWGLHVPGELRQWTHGEFTDRAPQWSPDGHRLSFLSNRGAGTQVFVFDPDSGESSIRALTRATTGISTYRWSPDGARIAYLGREPAPEGADDPKLADREHDLERLWIVDVATGATRRLTSGRWRIDAFEWIANDALAAIATDRPQVDAWTEALYRVDLASGSLSPLSRPAPPLGALSVSPRRSRLVFTAPRHAGPNPHDLYERRLPVGDPRNLTAAIDRPVKTIHWQDDSTLVVSVTDGFRYRLHRLRTGKRPEAIDLPLSARDFDVARDGTIAYSGHDFDRQSEIYLRAPDGTTRQVSALNSTWSDVRLASATVFRVTSFDGKKIEAALLRPPGAGARDKLPLVLLVHGGPASSFDASSTYWFGMWAQLLVARGHQALLVNPRGSEAYGEEFMKANRADWGGADYRDLMAAVDAVIARGGTDRDRLGIGGWSYGGYMSQWAPTRSSRFRAAVAGAGTFDLIAEYETEDSPAGDEWYFGTPWENADRFLRSSPNTFVRKNRTPTLILHGEDDPVNPVGQSLGFYRALKRYEVPCELVIYPREGHLLREEKHQVDALRRMADWFDRYLAAR